MAKNDSIILDSVIDEKIALKIPSEKRDEAFEFFAIEEILKDFSFKKEEILDGLIDGQNDGGIDAFFIVINGHCLTDTDGFYWPKSNVEIEVFLVTCKHHDTFKQAPLDNMVATLSEIMDFSISQTSLKGEYNDELLRKRELLNQAYRRVASKLSRFSFKVFYSSRGDTSNIGDPIQSRATQITQIIKNSFDNCSAEFIFWGSSELIESFRKKPNFSLELPFVEYLGKGERYVLLCTLTDYYKFITDDDNKLRRYLFDSNVRDFMGLNSVNEDIKDTLNDLSSPDFWWLNNGVTILATSGRVIGESIQIEDIQIVNGLQTTESIFNHFHTGKEDPSNRSVLVKVLVSRDAEIRDSIIRATNNQTSVQVPALHATDKIQRDIEDILLTVGLYYERRTNYYVNRNIPNSLIVSPLYLGAAFVGLIRKDPYAASGLKSKFMRNADSYKKVFSSEINILVWPAIAKVLKKCDEILEKNRVIGKHGNDGFLKKWRQVLAIVSVAKTIGSYAYSIQDLIDLNWSIITDAEINSNWNYIHVYDNSYNPNRFKNKSIIDKILIQFANDFNIKGVEVFKIGKNLEKDAYLPPYLKESFIDDVHALLPAQPWKADDLLKVSEDLKSNPRNVTKAINVLVNRGMRFKQKDGIVFDKDNKIIAIDCERVNQDELQIV